MTAQGPAQPGTVIRYNHPGHTLTPGVLNVYPEYKGKYFVFQTLWLLQSYVFRNILEFLIMQPFRGL